MKIKDQLIRFTKFWFIALVVTIILFLGFYYCPEFKVEDLGKIQFSNCFCEFKCLVSGHEDAIKRNTFYDLLFIVVYSVLFYFSYRVFQSSMRIGFSKWFAIFCLLPGFIDILENLFFLGLLCEDSSQWTYYGFWFLVRLKWTLIIPFILINFCILVFYAISLVNKLVVWRQRVRKKNGGEVLK